MTLYREFLEQKSQVGSPHGFKPIWLPDFLFGFQQKLTDWAIRQGRAEISADCGLGKTPMELVWASNVVQKTNKSVLLLAPLAVSEQIVREGDKFGVPCFRSRQGKLPNKPTIVVTNYERLGYFNPSDFSGVVCDESSILKNFNGKTKFKLTEFMRVMPYRLLCTATAAPNDYFELGTSSEALGYLGFHDMLSRFFKEDDVKDFLGWGRKTYRFRGHAERPFWKWVCSWLRGCRKPSDLGFSDDGFVLPPLVEEEVVVECSKPKPGRFFCSQNRTLQEQRDDRRGTIRSRCEVAADRVIGNDGPSVVWCFLNDEADLMEKLVKGSLQVSGGMPDDVKEERLLDFQSGKLKVLVTKPKIGCFGLNWQHCHNVVYFPSHSWEQYYQSVRRCWRFGQKSSVGVSIVTSNGSSGVLDNLRRKSKQVDRMFGSLIANMTQAIQIDPDTVFPEEEKVPSWL
ncbi:DEAD/DEAH box helicase [Candidatus Pacearchaeota archaeon]|jgi:hypothetical protein|nr:DEAD/DEAH box helicase [Candidatus Pacearchaeota archaeon]